MSRWSFLSCTLSLFLAHCQAAPEPSSHGSDPSIGASATSLADQCGSEGCACGEAKSCCQGLVCNTDLPHEGEATCVPRVAAGEACWADGQCHEGLFCFHAGYGPGACAAPQPNGASCAADGQCASGHCVEYICQAWACGGESAECFGDGSCCQGLVCSMSTNSYVPGSCITPRADGSYCTRSKQCASKRCENSVCVAG